MPDIVHERVGKPLRVTARLRGKQVTVTEAVVTCIASAERNQG